MPERDRITTHLPSFAAQAAGAVAAAIVGSLFGVAGTLIGLASGSVVASVSAWLIDKGLRHSALVARAKAQAVKRKGAPLDTHETAMIERVVSKGEKRAYPGIPWRAIMVGAGLVGLASATVILAIELGAGKPVSAVVQGHRGRGLVSNVAPVPPRHPASSSPDASSPAVSSSPAATPSASTSAPRHVVTPSPTPSTTAPSSPPVTPSSSAPASSPPGARASTPPS